MKILFTGGGTGGHFYPIIAIAQAINEITDQEKIVSVELFYISDTPYDANALFENSINFKKASAGKMRTYFSFKNILDIFKTGIGILSAMWQVFLLFPDVIVGKGGYASFPTLVAGWIFSIPVIIHESDTVPGRVNLWAGKFARKIFVSYESATKYFPKDRVVVSGNPIRKELAYPIRQGAHAFLKLEEQIPVIFVTGGSQGASKINDTLVDILPELVKNFQIIHQVGQNNFREVSSRANLLLEESMHKERYKIFPFLNQTAMRMVGAVSDLVISRAGSTIFEIAVWGLPSIVIPIPEGISRDQRSNAFAYAETGAASVIEEKNLRPTILLSEINRLMADKESLAFMSKSALEFGKKSLEAPYTIAREILNIGLEHE